MAEARATSDTKLGWRHCDLANDLVHGFLSGNKGGAPVSSFLRSDIFYLAVSRSGTINRLIG